MTSHEVGLVISLFGAIVGPGGVGWALAQRVNQNRRLARVETEVCDLRDDIREVRDGMGILLRHTAREDKVFSQDLADYAYTLHRDYVAGVPKTNGNRSPSPKKRGRR